MNFGLLAAEIVSLVWSTPATFNVFRVLAACSSGRQPNFAALNRGRHLCSAGRPSRWALAHILVISSVCIIIFLLLNCVSLRRTHLSVYYCTLHTIPSLVLVYWLYKQSSTHHGCYFFDSTLRIPIHVVWLLHTTGIHTQYVHQNSFVQVLRETSPRNVCPGMWLSGRRL